MFCSKCGAPNPDDGKFCSCCGAPLVLSSTETQGAENINQSVVKEIQPSQPTIQKGDKKSGSKKQKKKWKKLLWIILAIILVIVLLIVIVSAAQDPVKKVTEKYMAGLCQLNNMEDVCDTALEDSDEVDFYNTLIKGLDVDTITQVCGSQIGGLVSDFYNTLFDFEYEITDTVDNGDGTGIAYVNIKTHNFRDYFDKVQQIITDDSFTSSSTELVVGVLADIATDGSTDYTSQTSIDILDKALGELDYGNAWKLTLPVSKADDGNWYLSEPGYYVLDAISDGTFSEILKLLNETINDLEAIGEAVSEVFDAADDWLGSLARDVVGAAADYLA